MADAITIKALQDASLDAKSLEEVVNGNESKQITTRLGETYPSVKKAIKTMFENGGLPATIFNTKQELESSNLDNGSYAFVASGDVADVGYYKKDDGAWVYQKFSNVFKNLREVQLADEVIAVTDNNSKSPWYIDGAGVVNQSAIKVDSINGIDLSSDDDYGFPYVISDKNNKAVFWIDNMGVAHFNKLQANSISSSDINIDNATDASKDMKIDKSSHEWWIYPVHTQLTKPYERIVSASYGEDGSIQVSETVPNTGMVKKVAIDKSNANTIDDHESPALFAEEGRRFIAVWGRAGIFDHIKVYVSNQAGDIDSFNDLPVTEVKVGALSGSGQGTTYYQVFKLPKSTDEIDYFWIFGRSRTLSWGFVEIEVDQNTGAVTSKPWVRLISQPVYLSIADSKDKLRVTSAYNPAYAVNSFHYLEIDKNTGDITMSNNPTLQANIDGTGLPISCVDSTAVLADVKSVGTSRRLFYTRPGPIHPAFLYAEWPTDSPDDAVYKSAVLNGDEWAFREHGEVGKRFGHDDTANYIAGGCYPNPCHSDVMYLARYNNNTYLATLDYVKITDNGTESQEILSTAEYRIVRPMSLTNGSPLIAYSAISDYGVGGKSFAFIADIKLINKYGK